MSKLINFYKTIPECYKDNNNAKYPNWSKVKIDIPARILICGVSGSGKNNCLMNLILQMNCFTKIYIFAKNLDQPLYRFLISRMHKLSKKIGKKILFYSEDLEDIPELSEFDKSETNLIVFDDMIMEKNQKRISELFTRGRNSCNASCVYLTQNYYSVDKLIRRNCDYIIIKKINTSSDLKRIISEYKLSNNISLDQLYKFYEQIVASGMENFLLLDMKTDDPKLKYRMNFG